MPQFDVFLSHSSVDKPWVIKLKDDLLRYGVSVWLDKDEIRPGDLFAEALELALDDCRAVTLIVSPEAIKSGWVKEEYYRAMSLAKTKEPPVQVIPVILREAELPGFLKSRNRVDFRNESAYAQKVWELVWGITGEKPAQVLDLSEPDLPSVAPVRSARQTEALPMDSTTPATTTPYQPAVNSVRDTLLCYLHCFLRIPLISYNSKATGQRETAGIWLMLPTGILLAPFLGSVLWLGICKLYGWPYYLGGSGNEPHGFHAFLWGAITNGPVIVFALLVALPYTLPKISVLRTWLILILSYVVCSGLGGILFYNFAFRTAIEAYHWSYASQETAIIAVWSLIIALSTGVSLLVVFRVSQGLIHLPSIVVPIILPVIFSVLGLLVFLVLFPHLPISDWIRGIFAGLFLRFGMFIGLIVVFMFNSCNEFCWQ